MKAIVYDSYGSPDVLKLKDVDQPVPKADEVLVRIQAASVNPLDWHELTGTPYFMRAQSGLRKPKQAVLGGDFAGQIVAVGDNVTQFQPGAEVFGMCRGAFAEYACVREANMLLSKPANLTYDQAAAVPVAALTALQGLRDKGGVQPGHRVLINGASGGVGTFAVQLAKSFGAEVTGVCSTGSADMVHSIGADHVIDYTQHDFTSTGQRYDLVLDNVGTRSIADRKRLLNPDGILVSVSGPKTNRWLGPLTAMIKLAVAGRIGKAKMVPIFTRPVRDDLITLRELLEAGQITPVIGRSYPWQDVPEALGYVGTGHAHGKVVITM